MEIRFSIEGDIIRGVDFGSENHKKVEEIFDLLIIDLPAVPYPGQKVSLAKDGIVLEGTVDYVFLNWFAKDNGVFVGDERDSFYYFVRLKDMEIVQTASSSILKD